MFTGLVQCVGRLEKIVPAETGKRMVFHSPDSLEGVHLGDSIAVDGVCLTVIEISGSSWSGDVSHETLRVTSLGERRVGDNLHMERALRMGDPLGGHMVQGHVDFVGTRTRMTTNGESWDLAFRVPEMQIPYLVPKGSVAVDGVSLTVNWVQGDEFGVTIIPHTAVETHLTSDRVQVNIETDIVGKYIVGHLERLTGGKVSGIDVEFLAKHGFASK